MCVTLNKKKIRRLWYIDKNLIYQITSQEVEAENYIERPVFLS